MRFVPQYFRNGWDSKVEIVKSLLLREKGDRATIDSVEVAWGMRSYHDTV